MSLQISKYVEWIRSRGTGKSRVMKNPDCRTQSTVLSPVMEGPNVERLPGSAEAPTGAQTVDEGSSSGSSATPIPPSALPPTLTTDLAGIMSL